MTLKEIARSRLLNQQISGTSLTSPVEMIRWLGAVQAQEYALSKWGLGLRLPNIKDTYIEKDFNDGKIIRTHLLRPTWHFAAAGDVDWLLTLTAPRVQTVNSYMYRKLDLDKKIFNRCNNILIKILRDRKHLTRNIINEEFKKNKIIAERHRLSYIMMNAELNKIICSGPRSGNQFTYTLMDERIKTNTPMSYDEALAELTKRFFSSRGPATIKDFGAWSGLTLTDCKKGLGMTKTYFEKVVIEGDEYYFFQTTAVNKKRRGRDIYLLPVYDEFIMGYKNRNAMLQFKNSIKPDPPFHYDSMIVSDGQIIGTWKRSIGKKSINIKFDFFEPLNKSQQKAFTKAVHRFEEFTGVSVNNVSR